MASKMIGAVSFSVIACIALSQPSFSAKSISSNKEQRMTDSKILKTDNKVELKDVPIPPWGVYDASSVMASLTSVFTYIGDTVSYQYLMGISGHAFRIQLHKDGYCESAPHANCGYNCTQTVADELGYQRTVFAFKENDTLSYEKAKQAVVESINNGVPALSQPEEASVIVGYVDNGKSFLRRAWQSNKAEYEPLDKLAWGIDTYSKKNVKIDRRQLVKRSLERAVMLANTDHFENYCSGFRAYENWIAWLQEENRKSNFNANGWIYCCLKSARKAAYMYLEDASKEYSGDISKQLTKCSAAYKEVYDKLGVPCDVAPGPWKIKEEEWSQTMKNNQATILKSVLESEKKAIDEIKMAITMMK